MDPIRIGSDWRMKVTIGPTNGRTNSDVTQSMTDATYVGCLIVAGKKAADLVVSNPNPANRTIDVSIPITATRGLKPTEAGKIDLVLTEVSGLKWPIGIGHYDEDNNWIPDVVAVRRVV